jgi:hypothetical protein
MPTPECRLQNSNASRADRDTFQINSFLFAEHQLSTRSAHSVFAMSQKRHSLRLGTLIAGSVEPITPKKYLKSSINFASTASYAIFQPCLIIDDTCWPLTSAPSWDGGSCRTRSAGISEGGPISPPCCKLQQRKLCNRSSNQRRPRMAHAVQVALGGAPRNIGRFAVASDPHVFLIASADW